MERRTWIRPRATLSVGPTKSYVSFLVSLPQSRSVLRQQQLTRRSVCSCSAAASDWRLKRRAQLVTAPMVGSVLHTNVDETTARAENGDEKQMLIRLFRRLAMLGRVFSLILLVAVSGVIAYVARTQLALVMSAAIAAVGSATLLLAYNHLEFMMCSLAGKVLTPSSMLPLRRPQRIILVRHGESEGNVDRTLYKTLPDNKLELTTKGRRQSFELGRQLKNELRDESVLFCVSPYVRTRQTLEELLEGGAFRNYFVKENPHIREQEFGNFQDPDKHEYYTREREECGWFYHRMPGGESGADLYTRAAMFLETLFNETDRWARAGRSVDNVVIVTHGLTMRMLCMRYFDWSVDELLHVRAPRNAERWCMQWREDIQGYELMTDVDDVRQPQTSRPNWIDELGERWKGMSINLLRRRERKRG